jgi:hypothetical protein
VDTARQVVRWSIPGSILMLTAVMINLLSMAWERVVHHHNISLQVSPAEVAFMTLASIPIGYLTYQLYYRKDGRVRTFPARIVPKNRGYEVLRRVQAAAGAPLVEVIQRLGYTNLADLKLDPASIDQFTDISRPARVKSRPWRFDRALSLDLHHLVSSAPADRHDFYDDFRTHTALVRSLMMSYGSDDVGKSLVAEYTSLSDLYHGLGATRTSLALGVPSGALFLLFTPDRAIWGILWACIAGGSVAFGVYCVIHRNRAQVLDRLIITTQHGLCWLLQKPADASPPDGA